jgi:hypothetical protein
MTRSLGTDATTAGTERNGRKIFFGSGLNHRALFETIAVVAVPPDAAIHLRLKPFGDRADTSEGDIVDRGGAAREHRFDQTSHDEIVAGGHPAAAPSGVRRPATPKDGRDHDHA